MSMVYLPLLSFTKPKEIPVGMKTKSKDALKRGISAMVCLIKLVLITCMVAAMKAFNIGSKNIVNTNLKRLIGGVMLPLGLSLGASPPLPALAVEELRTVGEFQTSGLIFKDTLKINVIEDPKVPGVSLYFSEFDRPMNEKLSGDMFNDPSSTSLSCSISKGTKVEVGDISTSRDGEEVFEENRNLFLKQTRIRRIYDKQANNLVYVSYSTRLDKNKDTNKSRFKSSTCVVHLQ